jgi:transposase
MLFVGLDVHQRSSAICILDKNGKRVKRMEVHGHCSKVVEVLRGLKKRFAVCYEASCGYGWLYDRLRGVASRVVVAHPGQLRLIFRSKRKNDRVDAEKLAKLLFLDEVPPVYVPSVEVRSWRNLIEFRHRLVAKRTRVKNGLRSLLRGHGVVALSGKGLWTAKGRSWLAEVAFATPQAALQRDLLVDELASYDTQLARVEKELNRIGRQHPGVFLLQTIPGVGPRTAEAVMAYIDDARRFSRNKRIGSYFGLVPCQDQSADLNRLGHITRQGPATVRKLLTEAAWQGIRRSPHLREYFERIGRGDRKRRKIALVATAHYLARVMLAMLRTGAIWQWNQDQQKVA